MADTSPNQISELCITESFWHVTFQLVCRRAASPHQRNRDGRLDRSKICANLVGVPP